ncbi:MAG: hypothetical protein JXB14_05455 [Candidatus Altiarchaeota archaeon]|nr:hypothetical protein [Candidatus Altiarchaeota archaeon]
MIFVFDLEGPLSPMDHAAEAMRAIGKKVGKDDYFDFFKMLSDYDDLLVLEGKKDYNPGDTLRLIAPIVSTQLMNDEIVAISKSAVLTPGARDLISSLDKNDVYVASTSYHQHARTVGAMVGIRPEHINSTELLTYTEFPHLKELEAIYQKHKTAEKAKKELDDLFWKKVDPKFLKTRVCGGERKEEVVERVSRSRNAPISQFMAVGDSITDIHMLSRVAREGGLGISFNGSKFSIEKANIAVSANSLMALRPLVDAFPNQWDFVEKWNSSNGDLKLLKPETREYFIQHNVRAQYDDLRNRKNFDDVIGRQKAMRLELRKEYGKIM